MTKKVTTTISDELFDLRESYGVSWAECLRVGMAILLFERGCEGFTNPLNHKRIIQLAAKFMQEDLEAQKSA